MAYAYLAKKLARATITILCVVSLMFALLRLLPGDPVQTILGDQATAADREALRHSLHLDLPLWQQYALFLREIGSGSLGTSFRNAQPVSRLIVGVLPDTVILAACSLALAWLIAVPLGCAAAVFKQRWP